MSVVPPGTIGGPSLPSDLVLRSGSNPMSLGAVVFSSEETPAKWNIGAGEQMLAVTDLPGGGRVVQDFGTSAHEITWEAKFWGPNIKPRVQQIRSYMVSGEPQVLSWNGETYLVKIKSFDPGYMGGYNEYSITCVVIQDKNGAFAVQSPASVDQQVQALQSQAIIQQQGVTGNEPAGQTPTGDSVYGPALLNLWNVLQLASPLAQNIVTFGPQILALANQALIAVQSYQGQIPGNAPQYPYTVGLLSSIQTIMANVQSGTAPTSVSVPGGELFSIAALQYGDITQAFTIAAANSLVNPILPAGQQQSIAIPPQPQIT